MNIVLDIRNVYGIPLAYPENAYAKALAAIAGAKTLTPSVVAYALELPEAHLVCNGATADVREFTNRVGYCRPIAAEAVRGSFSMRTPE